MHEAIGEPSVGALWACHLRLRLQLLYNGYKIFGFKNCLDGQWQWSQY